MTRKRKTLIKYARQKGLSFPDLRAPPRIIIDETPV
jgi:hypothetical protein